jgi:hypothetical protein
MWDRMRSGDLVIQNWLTSLKTITGTAVPKCQFQIVWCYDKWNEDYSEKFLVCRD